MTCPKCRSRLHISENLMGGYDGSVYRGNTGFSCWSCGHWQDIIHVHMPDIPPPDHKFTKSAKFIAACKRNGRKSNPGFVRAAVIEHMASIKFWMFNGASIGECCAKLAAKGVGISRTSLGTHLNEIAREQGAA